MIARSSLDPLLVSMRSVQPEMLTTGSLDLQSLQRRLLAAPAGPPVAKSMTRRITSACSAGNAPASLAIANSLHADTTDRGPVRTGHGQARSKPRPCDERNDASPFQLLSRPQAVREPLFWESWQ